MNIKTTAILILLCVSNNLFGQSNNDSQHEKFMSYIKSTGVDSIYSEYSKVTANDKNYEKALLYKNQYGWILDKYQDLKKYIPEILSLPQYSKPLSYEKIFNPQKFPRSEWNRFYETSALLTQYFSNQPPVYKEILWVKIQLEFLTSRTDSLVVDLPRLLILVDKESSQYSDLLWMYGNALKSIGKTEEALTVFISGFSKKSNNEFLISVVEIYSKQKSYSKIIALETDIVRDSSIMSIYALADAYQNLNNINKAKVYFDAFTSKLKFTDYYPFVSIENSNITYSISAIQLDNLGAFYWDSSRKQSCQYYSSASTILKSGDDENRFKKQIATAGDDVRRKEHQEKYDKYSLESKALLAKIETKLTKCN
jgi:hypothetical protein